MKSQLLSAEEQFRKEVLRRSSLWIGVITATVITIRTATGYIKFPQVYFAIAICSVFFLIPVLLKRGSSSRFCSFLLLSGLAGLATLAGVINGGIQAPASITFAILPLIGFLTSGEFGARIALLYSFSGLGLFLLGEEYGWIQIFQRPLAFSKFLTLSFLSSAVAAYVIGKAYENSRRKLERKILEMVSVMQENIRLASLGEMASGVAHEINNPLTIIVGTADRIKRLLRDPSKSREEIEKEIDNLRTVAFRAGNIAKGLQDLSRDAQSDPFAKVPVKVLLDQTLLLCQERYRKYGVELRIPSYPACDVECRETQISQAVLNLLNNAFDAVANLPEKWVQIDIKRTEANRLQISITDSGKGIPDSIANKLMEPFFTTKTLGKGTGLGLSISNRIIADHQGSFFLDRSHPNTRFVMDIPIHQNTPDIHRQQTSLPN